MLSTPYFVIIPLAAAFFIPIFGKKIKAAGATALVIATFLLAVTSFANAPSVMANKVSVFRVGNWAPPFGIPIVVDALSIFMLITVNTIAFLAAVYSVDYMKKFTDTWKFYSLFSFMVAGMNGVLIAGDIFNMYVFLEIAAIAGYFLVAFGIEAEEFEAAFKYAVMGAVASIFILLGIAFLYGYTSTLNMADMASVIAFKGGAKVMLFVSVLFIMGFGLKAALVPFHSWLPYAHSSAPAPISAMLSGVSIKVLGIYALARIFFNVFGMGASISGILIFLGSASMILGGLLAFGQDDMKRLFAYSSISQIGYIALGLGIGTPLAIFGALFHLLNHSIFKSLLFLDSGSIEHTAGTRDLSKISGVIADTPVTGYTTLIGALAICGMPPLGGFWSKLIIILACIQAGCFGLAFMAIAVSVLTLAYYFRALTPALFGTGSAGMVMKKLSWVSMIPLAILAFLSIAVALMLLPNAGNSLLKDAASVLVNGKDYAGALIGVLK